MSNSELFKQAIAEAKAVREAAIANAKAALEESLTPHIKELLAAKLQEMDSAEDDEEEDMKAEGMHNMPEADAEMSEAEDKEEAEEEKEEEGEEKAEEEEIDLEDMSVEDLKDLIRDIIADEMGEEEGEMEADAEMGAEMGAEAGMEDAEDDTINLDELLAELAEMGNMEPANEVELDENAQELIKKAMGMGKDTAKKVIDALGKAIDYTPLPSGTTGKQEGVEEAAVEESAQDLIKKALAMGKDAAKSVVDALGKAIDYTPLPSGTTGKQEAYDPAELNEAKKAIETLRKDLHEVNLLNSKLLYVNKIFKAKNLSESQKVNVIAAFDKAETVKETKLVYETLSEQFAKAASKSVNEVKGFASKPVGGSAPKAEIISEDATVKRLQKLAGIIK